MPFYLLTIIIYIYNHRKKMIYVTIFHDYKIKIKKFSHRDYWAYTIYRKAYGVQYISPYVRHYIPECIVYKIFDEKTLFKIQYLLHAHIISVTVELFIILNNIIFGLILITIIIFSFRYQQFSNIIFIINWTTLYLNIILIHIISIIYVSILWKHEVINFRF